ALESALQPDFFFSAGGGNILAQWNATTGINDGALLKNQSAIYTFKKIQHLNLLLIGLSDGGIHFLYLQFKKILKSSQIHKKGIFTFAVHPVENHMIATSGDGSFSIWNLDTFECLTQAKILESALRTVDFHPFEKSNPYFVIGGSDSKIRQY